MTIQQILLSGFTLQSYIYIFASTSGASVVTAPAGATGVIVEAIGGGGTGYGQSVTANRASGGGGQYARSGLISVAGGTSVYYWVGTTATSSWVNVGTNAQPSSAATGCLAPNGTSASSGVAGVGNSGTVIGIYTAFGANGLVGLNAVGGGGAGAGSSLTSSPVAGSGQYGGTDTTGISVIGYQGYVMGDGTGGNSAALSTVGVDPGGGGGAGTSLGTNRAGGIGRVRINFF
jgi:hypothetical protein